MPDRAKSGNRRGMCIFRATVDLNLVRAISSIWTNLRSRKKFGRAPTDITAEAGHTGQDMKIVTGLLAAVLLLAGVASSHAIVRIADDRGGRIGTYIDKYQSLRGSNESIMIDGLCASACTIVLGAVSPDRICVTSRANLGFHAAWDFGARGQAVTNPEATRMLFAMYPPNIRRWINQRGGLKPRMIFLSGRQLSSMYRPCYMDAQASSRGRNE
jgi:hypothetical protein